MKLMDYLYESPFRDFDKLFEMALRETPGYERKVFQALSSKSYPKTDIVEDENHFRITCAMPGLNKEQIKVFIENGVLTVQGEKRSEVEHRSGLYFHSKELVTSSFSRSWSLPENMSNEEPQLSFSNGLLEIIIKKKVKKEIKDNKRYLEIK